MKQKPQMNDSSITMHYTLSTYALEKRDKLFVNSMLELTKKKLGINWVLNDTEGQAVLVDVDQPAGANFWQAYHAEKKLIAFAQNNHLRAALFLEKPLRVQPFTELLKKLSESLPDASADSTAASSARQNATPSVAVAEQNAVSAKMASDSHHYDPMQYLSGLLQAALHSKEILVLNFAGFAPLYVLPEEKRCYTDKMGLAHLNPSQRLFFAAHAEQFSRHVLSAEQARSNIVEQDFKPYDIHAFIWGSALLSSNGRLLHNHSMQTFVRLKQWPNFATLPHEPEHMKLAAFMLKNTANIPRIASATRMPMATVTDFFNACAMSNLLLLQKAQATTSSAEQQAAGAEKLLSSEKRSLLGNILRRLGR